MFKSFTKDLTGTADICTTARDLRKLHAAAYLLPGETILFAFESAKEEFSFTNEALLLVEGENATTTRKLVERVEYRDNAISGVKFETTGRVDRDCEIKFRIGAYDVSIDIARKEEDKVKAYYKVLVLLAREQQERFRHWNHTLQSADKASDSLRLNGAHQNLVALAADATAWMDNAFAQENPRCYREVIVSAMAEVSADARK
jgi:hypothetical protein